MFPDINQLGEGTSSNTTSGASVPVMYSPQPIKGLWEYQNLKELLPCICGDEIGNETMRVFRETNFQSWVAVEGGKVLAEACQTSFQIDETWPVQAYLAFFHLRWHFPTESDKHSADSTNAWKHRFGMGADVMCEQAEQKGRGDIKRAASLICLRLSDLPMPSLSPFGLAC